MLPLEVKYGYFDFGMEHTYDNRGNKKNPSNIAVIESIPNFWPCLHKKS